MTFFRRTFVLLVLLLSAGCARFRGGDFAGILAGEGRFWGIALLGMAGGAILYAVLGGLAAFLAYRFLRGRRAFAVPIRREAWIRRGCLALMLASGVLGGGAAGVFEGGWWAYRRELDRGSARVAMDAAGLYGAEVMVALHRLAAKVPEGFGDGLPVETFLKEMEVLPDMAVDQVLPALEAKWPQVRHRLGERGMKLVAEHVVRRWVVRSLEKPLATRGVGEFGALRRSLLRCVEQEGRDGVLGVGPLGGWVRRELVMPLVEAPVRKMVRGNQIGILILVLLSWILPILVLWWFRRRLAGKPEDPQA